MFNRGGRAKDIFIREAVFYLKSLCLSTLDTLSFVKQTSRVENAGNSYLEWQASGKGDVIPGMLMLIMLL